MRLLKQISTIDWNRLQENIGPPNRSCAHRGLRSMTQLDQLSIHDNQLQGMFPQEGVAKMIGLKRFAVNGNRFTGTLADQCLGSMSLVYWLVHANQFSGPLPDRTLGPWKVLQNFVASDNFFQGSVPGMASSRALRRLIASHNLLEGAMPQYLAKEIVALGGMAHEGTIPLTVNRMSGVDVDLVFGHGLA
eukprot:2128571-Amphidinium_carterae.1